MALQRHARLSVAVVEHQLAVGAAAALAGRHRLALEARQRGRVGVRTALTWKPWRRISCRNTGALCHCIALFVDLSLAVINAADHNGTINISVEEVDQDFAADAGQGVRAPVTASNWRQRRRDTHPCARLVTTGRASVAVRCWMIQSAVTQVAVTRAPLPVELHLDSMIAVSMNDRAGRSYHDRCLLATYRRARIEHNTVTILCF